MQDLEYRHLGRVSFERREHRRTINTNHDRRAQAVAMIAQEATNQSYVMAYNDAYLLTSLAAMAALAALLLHMMRDAMANRLARKTQPETETA